MKRIIRKNIFVESQFTKQAETAQNRVLCVFLSKWTNLRK